MKEYLLSNHMLHATQNGIMSYCPYCYKETKKRIEGTKQDFKDFLKPLIYKKFLVLDGKDKHGNDIKYINEYWECTHCERKLTTDDFVLNYCTRADGSKYSEPKREKNNERIDAV